MERSNLPQGTKKTIADFTAKLKSVYEEDLLSVIVYGSAASGNFIERRSNIDLAIILNDASLPNLARSAALIRKRKFRVINPIFFTEDYIRRSADVFPIEFLDMRDNHCAIYGRDILKDVEISTVNLRFQCEHELKAKLLGMRRFYLRNTDKALLRQALFKYFTSCMHILTNLIRLKIKKRPQSTEELLRSMSEELKIGTSSLAEIFSARDRQAQLSHGDAVRLFTAFVSDLEKIVDAVDRF